MGKLPYFGLYPGDWLKDQNLRRCSLAARGMWIDMLCLMFECEERGVFATDGVAWPDQDIAACISGDTDANLLALAELLAKGVCRRRNDAAIYSRRMVADAKVRKTRAIAGRKGGKRKRSKPQANREAKHKQNPEYETEYENAIESESGNESGNIVGFPEFWASVPNKVGKRQAEKAYRLAVLVIRSRPIEAGPGADAPDAFLTERMLAFAASPIGRGDQKYIPHPATWLNAGRYDDDQRTWNAGRNDPRGTMCAAEQYLGISKNGK